MAENQSKTGKKTVQISNETHVALTEYCKSLGLKISAFVEKLISNAIKK